MTATLGAVAGMRCERLLGGAGLADDLEVVLDFEELAHAAPHDLVVVEEEDANRHAAQAMCRADRRSTDGA